MSSTPLSSIIISQTAGLYLLMISIIMTARAKFYRKMVTDLKLDNGVIFVGASFSLIIGLMMLDVHNIWRWSFESGVSLLCWLIVVISVLWLAFPEKMLSFAKHAYTGNAYYVSMLITAIIGMLLMAHGFYLFMLR